MKKFRKLIVALLAMAMVIGCLTMQASAADEVTVKIVLTGEIVESANNMNFYNWVPNETLGAWPGTAMTKESAGVFSINVTVPSSTTTISGKFNGDAESNDVTGLEVKKEVITVTMAADKSYTVAYSGNDLVTVDLDEGKETKDIKFNVKLDGTTTNEKMYAHVWEDGFEGSKVKSWPGYELTLNDGVYSADIPVEKSEEDVKVIIHNESESIKTDDKGTVVDVTSGKAYFTVKADSSVEVSTTEPDGWITGNTGSGSGSDSDTGNTGSGSGSDSDAGNTGSGSGSGSDSDAGNTGSGSGNKPEISDNSVTQEEIDAMKDSVKVEGTTEKLVVSPITKDAADLKVVEAAVAKELKGVKYVVADLKFESGKQPTAGTKITIDVTKMADVKAAKFVAVYSIDDGKLELVDTVEVKDGKITFAPKHFSTYVFAEAADPKSDPDNGIVNTAVIVSAIVMLAAATVIVASKKRVTE